MQSNPGYLLVILLSRVVVQLGTLDQINPKTIALNFGTGRGQSDGLTFEGHKFLAATLGKDYESRFVSSGKLVTDFLDTRIPEELEHYRTAVLVTDILTRRAFSNEVITPGKTTVGDVRWWLLEQVNNLGLTVWFQPDLRVQREAKATETSQQFLAVADEATVLQRGDVLHVDDIEWQIVRPEHWRNIVFLETSTAECVFGSLRDA